MKQFNTFTAALLLAGSTLGTGLAQAAPPAAQVFQNTSNSESVELSNLDNGATDQAAVTVDAAANAAAAPAEARPAAANRRVLAAAPKPRKIKKKVQKPDGTEEEMLVDEEEADNGYPTEGGTRSASDARDSETTAATNSGGYGGGFSGGFGGGFAGGGYAAGGASMDSGVGATSLGSSATGAGSGLGNGSGGGVSLATGTGSNGNNVPIPTTALETKLAAYRSMMLNEVTTTQLANPALTRRYQQMDKATFQSRSTP